MLAVALETGSRHCFIAPIQTASRLRSCCRDLGGLRTMKMARKARTTRLIVGVDIQYLAARPIGAVGTTPKWAAKHRGHGVEARPPSVSLGILIGPSSASLVNADAGKLLIYSVGRRHLNTLALTKNHALAGRITSGASNITSS